MEKIRSANGPEPIEEVNVHQREWHGEAGSVEGRNSLQCVLLPRAAWSPPTLAHDQRSSSSSSSALKIGKNREPLNETRRTRRTLCRRWRLSESEDHGRPGHSIIESIWWERASCNVAMACKCAKWPNRFNRKRFGWMDQTSCYLIYYHPYYMLSYYILSTLYVIILSAILGLPALISITKWTYRFDDRMERAQVHIEDGEYREQLLIRPERLLREPTNRVQQDNVEDDAGDWKFCVFFSFANRQIVYHSCFNRHRCE